MALRFLSAFIHKREILIEMYSNYIYTDGWERKKTREVRLSPLCVNLALHLNTAQLCFCLLSIKSIFDIEINYVFRQNVPVFLGIDWFSQISLESWNFLSHSTNLQDNTFILLHWWMLFKSWWLNSKHGYYICVWYFDLHIYFMLCCHIFSPRGYSDLSLL